MASRGRPVRASTKRRGVARFMVARSISCAARVAIARSPEPTGGDCGRVVKKRTVGVKYYHFDPLYESESFVFLREVKT